MLVLASLSQSGSETKSVDGMVKHGNDDKSS